VIGNTESGKSSVSRTLAQDGWVCDGNYRGRLGSYTLERADLVVWLDLPLRIVLARVVRRTARRVRTREKVLGTNVETWRNFFFALRSERDVERFLAEA
jgi:adenylate kinase family enzyme